MISTKETIEKTLTEYGVAFTDALADRLIKEIYYECDQYLNAEQFVHLIKPIIEADKAESEGAE